MHPNFTDVIEQWQDHKKFSRTFLLNGQSYLFNKMLWDITKDSELVPDEFLKGLIKQGN